MLSVCIATYNGAAYLRQQLDSILSQLGPTDEVILSDDGSTDDTLLIAQEYAQRSATPIHIYNNVGDHGYVANFEHALSHAQGDYIFLSDQDDVWSPDKVRRMMSVLQSGQAGMVVSNASITDADLQITQPDYFAARGVYHGLLGNIFKFGYLGSCMAFTRDVLQRALPLPPRHDYCTHDNWLFLVAQATSRVVILREPLLFYRRHDGTSSTGALNAHKPWSFRIKYRLYLIRHLLNLQIRHACINHNRIV